MIPTTDTWQNVPSILSIWSHHWKTCSL